MNRQNKRLNVLSKAYLYRALRTITMRNKTTIASLLVLMFLAVGLVSCSERVTDQQMLEFGNQHSKAGTEAAQRVIQIHGKFARYNKQACRTCHEDPQYCKDCHSQEPKYHTPAFKKRTHGRMARMEKKTCLYCHENRQTECQECHDSVQPRTHNTIFKTKTHGARARMDKQRCKTCHQQNTCENCHQKTQPVSHTPTFKNRPTSPGGHCNSCHHPFEQSSCVVCHQRTTHP